MKNKLKDCAMQCSNFPFCYACSKYHGKIGDLQAQINEWFKDTPYRVTVEVPRFDEFEQKLYDIMCESGCAFTNKDRKTIEKYIQLQASLLRRIWLKDYPINPVGYNLSLQGLERDLDEYFKNRLDAHIHGESIESSEKIVKDYAQRITCKVLKDCYEEHCKDDTSQSS